MINVSNAHGRALEYIIVEKLNSSWPGEVSLTSRAVVDQNRDAPLYGNLNTGLINSYSSCAEKVVEWLYGKYGNKPVDIMVDRLSDQDARRGDVTDICITSVDENINLSVKNRHLALKHQRPSATAQHCGFKRNSQEDKNFKHSYKSIVESFIRQAKADYTSASLFRELNAEDPGYVSRNLYRPVCGLVADFIGDVGMQQENAFELFKFLVGSADFYKIVNYEAEVHVYEFARIAEPTSLTVEQDGDSYVFLQFSNGWRMSLRLHTASSRISDSLKFDTQLANPDELMNVVPRTVLQK